MTSRFLSRNGETYRVLHQNDDGCWLISFDNSTERPFRVAVAEMDSFQRVPAPQDFSAEDCNLTPAAQKRLALIQPLLDQDISNAGITRLELVDTYEDKVSIYAMEYVYSVEGQSGYNWGGSGRGSPYLFLSGQGEEPKLLGVKFTRNILQFPALTLCNSANGGKALIFRRFRHLPCGRVLRISQRIPA